MDSRFSNLIKNNKILERYLVGWGYTTPDHFFLSKALCWIILINNKIDIIADMYVQYNT